VIAPSPGGNPSPLSPKMPVCKAFGPAAASLARKHRRRGAWELSPIAAGICPGGLYGRSSGVFCVAAATGRPGILCEGAAAGLAAGRYGRRLLHRPLGAVRAAEVGKALEERLTLERWLPDVRLCAMCGRSRCGRPPDGTNLILLVDHAHNGLKPGLRTFSPHRRRLTSRRVKRLAPASSDHPARAAQSLPPKV
jgi:hypothetical protein